MAYVQAQSLGKSFGDFKAVDGLSFSVEQGEIFGLLGPNGAGKSTTIMILTTLLKPSSGAAYVAGHNVVERPGMVRASIGCVQQEPASDEFLTGRENLTLHAKLNRVPSGSIRGRVDEALSLIELEDRQHDAVLTYSGGMKKRLDIAAGLLHRPRVLFLDEPTVGLDIQTRRKIWAYIGQIRKESGTSILVSTHYMEEADSLCDRVGIIDSGKLKAIDTPESLKAAMGGQAVRMSAAAGAERLAERLRACPSVSSASHQGQTVTAHASAGAQAAKEALDAAAELGIEIGSFSVVPQTLDDVFLSYTGRELRDGEAGKKAWPRARRSRRDGI